MHALETFRSNESTGQGTQAAAQLAAFAEALKEHLAGLRAKATRMERTASDADDLVQDTLERALRSWQRFAPGTNLRCWLHTIMHNLFLDHCRSRNRRESMARDAAQDAEGEMLWEGEKPEWESISVAEVQDLSRELRPALRDAVELVFFCGLNYEQAAERLRIPKATVGTRLLRARRQLRLMIEQRRGEPAAVPAAVPLPSYSSSSSSRSHSRRGRRPAANMPNSRSCSPTMSAG
jgi:RNA polymerase sigma-70 factor (ECF subfamily)